MSDRLSEYFTGTLKEYIFMELSEDFLEHKIPGAALDGVPVPVKEEDLKSFAGGGLPLAKIGERMVWVIGCDREFPHADAYLAFLKGAFDEKIILAIKDQARSAIEAEDFEAACVYFRAMLEVDEKNLDAMYGYARSCREVYLSSEDEEKTGDFKAEAMEYFEKTTLEYPDFAEAHYFLGYAYLNMGLYLKARLAWEDFLAVSEDEEMRAEIAERVNQLSDPVKIEEGLNHIIAGRYAEGAKILEPFLKTHSDWWPLHYYLGVAFLEMGDALAAEERFKAALRLNPSHEESMKELADIYRASGDEEKAYKYTRKLELVKSESEAD